MSAPTSSPTDGGPGLPHPTDLAAGEADVAAWLGELDVRPPEALGDRVLGSYEPPPAAGFRVPGGRFGLVAAALVVLAVGAVGWLSFSARDAQVDARKRKSARAAQSAPVFDEPAGSLYRGLEDFRSLDVGRPDEDELAASCGEVLPR